MARMSGAGPLVPHAGLSLMLPRQEISPRVTGRRGQEVHWRARRDGGGFRVRADDDVAGMTGERPPGAGHEQQERRYEGGTGEEGEALPSLPGGRDLGHQQLLGLPRGAAVLGRGRRGRRAVAAVIAVA
jgi:hypothetical protein